MHSRDLSSHNKLLKITIRTWKHYGQAEMPPRANEEQQTGEVESFNCYINIVIGHFGIG
jgi:hypothetical protein